jgi:gliding motility-associated-like protein
MNYNKLFFLLLLFSHVYVFSQNINMQNGSFNNCTGTFFDSGGGTGNYSNNENLTITLCPDIPDTRLVLEFVEFELADIGLDVLEIYDADTADPAALINDFSGSLTAPGNALLNYITASDQNLSGCLTLVFDSNGSQDDVGWEAELSCREVCPEITIGLDSVSPAIFNGNSYELCFGDQIVFDANFQISNGDPNLVNLTWDFDDGNTANGEVVANTFNGPGIYEVAITANYPNCQPEVFFIEVRVSDTPEIILTADFEQVCTGEEVTLNASTNTTAVTSNCGQPFDEFSYMPDGVGSIFNFPITVECFGLNQTITNADDIINVCVTLEHSFLGDINISLISPDGAEILLADGADLNGVEIWLGEPDPEDNNAPGIGYQYCFDLSASNLLINGNTTDIDNPLPEDPNNTTPTILPGSYLPVESFSNLIGSTINGEWNLQIIDNVQFDSGYIFEWTIDFDDSLVPSDNIFEPSIIKQEWIGYEGQGNQIVFNTTSQTGNFCFEYEVIDSFGCVFSEEICVDVLPLPSIISVEDIFECDSDPNIPTTFDLTINDSNIFGPQDPNDFILTYHTSQQAASQGVNSIPNPSAFVSAQTPRTIFVRLESIVGNCVSTGLFRLYDSGLTGEIPPLEQCSITGQEIFDLTDRYPDILSAGQNLNNYDITFHNTESDAIIGFNEIIDFENYQSSQEAETIWVRVENNIDDSCFDIGNFQIIVHDQPVIAQEPLDLSQCTAVVQSFDLTANSANSMGVSVSVNSGVTYHESLDDANSNSNPIPDPLNYVINSNFATIWVRVENLDFTECFAISSFDLIIIESQPINLSPPPLIECDDDNDGFYNLFDLTEKDEEISLNTFSTTITYHLTEEDAKNNVGALSSPYSNVVENSQTIYFRAVDTTSGCIQVSSFEIQVVDSPLLSSLDGPLIGCDDDDDGTLVFDLTQVENQLLGNNLNPSDLDINYHLSLSDAQNNISSIGQPSAFQNTSNPQTIWVRVNDISNPHGCFDIEPIVLQVSPLPDFVFAEPFNVCDDEAGGSLDDEIAFFDFNDVIDEITQVNNELLVEFFESPEDLDNNSPISPIDEYQNSNNPQTIYVKITSGTTGCIGESSFTIFVEPTPSLDAELEAIEVCDADNDGFDEFDLASAIPDILNNEPEVTITFHLSQAAANLGVNPIDTSVPFGLINPNQQTLYVRAENTGPNGDDGSGCFDTRPIDLIVNPSPEIQDLTDLSICDDENSNGFASFDLTENSPLILGNQNASDLQLTYHENQNDAESGINPIAVPSNYTNLTNPQTIYVRLEDPETGCYDLYNSSNDVNNTFTLNVEPVPIAIAPTDLQVCNDDYDDSPFPQTVFDLTVKEPEVSGVTIVPNNLEFSYFLTQADLDNDVNPIEDPENYTNLSQPQDIFVKVTDTSTENLCFNSTIITISVLPLPSPSETDQDVLRISACDDDNDGIAALPFDLTTSGVLISENENVILSYYETESGAIFEDSDDIIPNPSAYVNNPSLNTLDENGVPTNTQIIYTRVDNNTNTNFCFVIVPFEIVVQPAPQLNPDGDPFAYTLCEDDFSDPGFATIFSTQDITNNLWDVTNGSGNNIIPLLDPDVSPAQNIEDFEVTYHETLVEAEDGTNAIQPGYLASDGQVLYIRVTHIETDCYNTNFIGLVQIIIEPRPSIAGQNPQDLEICADNVGIPNVGTVDLSIQDPLINTNDPEDFSVVYYASLSDYNDGVAIEDPSNFQTSESPQTIIAEVINNMTLCESLNFINFDIIVRPSPNLILTDEELILCFDENGEVIENAVSPPIIETGLSNENHTFTWQLNGVTLNETSSELTANQPGVYAVTATNITTGCEATDAVTVTEVIAPSFDVEIITQAFSQTAAIEITLLNAAENVEFQLNDGEWISLSPGQTTLILNTQNFGTQTIRARDSGGCGIVERTITVIDYPDFFTPNEDGINDTWNIDLDQPGSSLHIFDRYGKLLKELKPGGLGWDGTFNGKPMPAQSYWFRIDYVEPLTGQPNTFRSHFILKR